MMLKRLHVAGFKSFARMTDFVFDVPVIAIVGPNGSGKSNVIEALRFVLGEQSMKSLRGKSGSDLIFKGSSQIGKLARASVVVVFDNTRRQFKIASGDSVIDCDFDEIQIGREVYADGTNRYTLNSTEVRHKDILELIASVNIGSSGHHIISQGEADRLLNASARDRKIMIEEALGLRVYHYRIREAMRKLDRTRENLREVELLKKEIAPHLRFLKKQVDQFEQAKVLREELARAAGNYFAMQKFDHERVFHDIKIRSHTLSERALLVQSDLDRISTTRAVPQESPFKAQEELLERKRRELASAHGELSRALGRTEGMIEALNETLEESHNVEIISFAEYDSFRTDMISVLDRLQAEPSLDRIREGIAFIREKFFRFGSMPAQKNISDRQESVDRYHAMREDLVRQISEIDEAILVCDSDLSALRTEKEAHDRVAYEAEKEFLELSAQKNAISAQESALQRELETLRQSREMLEEDRREIEAFVGTIPETSAEGHGENIDHDRRMIERMKIRLEELGGGSGTETVREYEDLEERDRFLSSQIHDLEHSMRGLTDLVTELETSLDEEFSRGIKSINNQFKEFFSTMFGGGDARLVESTIQKRSRKTDDEENNPEEEGVTEMGIDIEVNVPRKKVQDLDMLSGGERSLTSIALLFALSQVNPPPFLVLDETDAALDEANSRKYGDMIESLARYSQLVVVTHNRETMSRASLLYGVTLGSDDSSKVLSIKLDEAVKIAK